MDEHDDRPSDSYTLADLEFLALRTSANPRMERYEVLGLKLDPHEIAEMTLAKETDDAHTLRVLANSSYETVPRLVAGNHATPVDVVRALALTRDALTIERAVVHPALTAADLEFIFHVGVEVARMGLLRNPNTPDRIMELAADDPSSWVRAGAAFHPRVTAAVLGRLALDPDSSPRAAAARNRRLPALAYTVLAADPDEWVRAALAENPVIPQDVLAQLATDPGPFARRAVAGSTVITPEIADRLTGDDSQMVREHLARNSSCPPGTLATLARRNQTVSVRTAVAQNPACPPGVLRRLAERDRSAYVRRFASSAWRARLG